MKKRDVAALAVLGISAGLVVGGCGQKNGSSSNRVEAAEHGQMSPDMQAFYASLSPDAQKKFMALDAQHKMMVMEMANQGCNGQNSCRGMGGCANAKNSCAGENACKGQGGAPVKNADEAVDVQYRHQMGERDNMYKADSSSRGMTH